MKTVFLLGAKSIGKYGGFETFVDKITEYFEIDDEIKFYVACKKNGQGAMDPQKVDGAKIISDSEFIYHNANCFQISIPEFLGPAQAIIYDLRALRKSIEFIKQYNVKSPIVYIMACRIGPFFKWYVNIIHKLGGKVFINPDGHEWKRTKWNVVIRKYWKFSEKLMVEKADLVICDSECIEEYIKNEYNCQNTTFIAYGANVTESKVDKNIWDKFLSDNNIQEYEYYLVVGRMIPENNYEVIINEFIRSDTKKNLVLVCDYNKKLYNQLVSKNIAVNDSRIKFVGTIYDEQLMKKIRENAYGYIHGHSVGGTNPSLLEGMASTNICLVYDVEFNREVGRDSVIYWNLNKSSLAQTINKVDCMNQEDILLLGKHAKNRIVNSYSWEKICNEYKRLFVHNV